MRERKTILRTFVPTEIIDRAKDKELPDGICGRVIGQACTYNSTDDYGTFFKPGCFDRSRAEKVPAGKVGLFRDHDHVSAQHVGVVRKLDDIGDKVMMSADLFDTDEGRATKEYLDAVLRAKGSTGLSVGVYERKGGMYAAPDDPGNKAYGFDEVELAEISVTPFPAVEGAEVMAVRRTRTDRGPSVVLRALLTSMPRDEVLRVASDFGLCDIGSHSNSDAGSGAPAVPDSIVLVDPQQRMQFLRDNMERIK